MLLRIDLIALPITVRDRTQLPDVGHDHIMAKLLQLLADPDRVGSRFHRHARMLNICKPLLDRLRRGSKTGAIDHFAVLVESAVMAPNIAKVNANCHLHPGLSAWDFCDEVLRWLFHKAE